MSILVLLAWLFVGFLLAAVIYRAIFAAAYLLGRRPGSDASPPDRERSFAVVIPAHDEESFIADVITSLRATDYPQERLQITVVADNCSDRTAEVVRSLGENVLERIEPENRGKGQALDWAFQQLDLSGVDAVALFDADNFVEPGYFQAMNRELERGRRCLQGYNGISNPEATVMTRLLSVTYVMKNLLFNGGKAVLGLSVVLNGTSMVFARDVIERIGWKAMTIGEDLEQTFYLLDHGERVHFVADARSSAQESTTFEEGYTQRQRWTAGRRALSGTARSAVLAGLRKGSIRQVECGIDLLMPTYAKLMNWSVVALVGAFLLRSWDPRLLWGAAVVLGYQALEVGIALILMKAEPRFLLSLAYAPVFLVWRAGVELSALLGRRPSQWTRATRTRGEDD
jgi:cellulose synthase/poly-beta-1,6-N-acetylglucosamine synthase-like glycosyltransferase